MRKLMTGVVIGAVLAGLAMTGSAATDVERRAQDRDEIEALMWRYARALDGFNPDAYAAAYTPDGEFRSGQTATKGRDALRKMVSDLKQRRVENEAKGQKQAAMYHMTTNEHLEFLGRDRARLHTYWQTVFGSAGPGEPVRVAAAGRGVDDLVKVNGQWLIQSRNVAPQD